MELKLVDISVNIERERVFAFLGSIPNDSLPPRCPLHFEMCHLVVVHHGISVFDDDHSPYPFQSRRQWLRYLPSADKMRALQSFETCFEIDCEFVTLSVGGKANMLSINGLDCQYHSDVVSLMMSPLIGYQLLNAMTLDFESFESPTISIHTHSANLCIDDVHFGESMALFLYFAHSLDSILSSNTTSTSSSQRDHEADTMNTELDHFGVPKHRQSDQNEEIIKNGRWVDGISLQNGFSCRF